MGNKDKLSKKQRRILRAIRSSDKKQVETATGKSDSLNSDNDSAQPEQNILFSKVLTKKNIIAATWAGVSWGIQQVIAAKVDVQLSATVFLISLLALAYFIMPKTVWRRLVFGINGRLSSSSLAVFLFICFWIVRLLFWNGWVGLLLPSNTPNLQNPIIIQAPIPTKSPTVIQPTPTFVDKDPLVTINVGSNIFRYRLSALEDAKRNPIHIGDYYPIQVYSEQGKLFADVTIFGGSDKPSVEIRHNEFLVRPKNWDRNSNQDALEILNDKQEPVLQLIYTNQEHTNIQINGFFAFQDRLIIVTPTNMWLPGMGNIVNYNLGRIFKYPSWKYPGELAN